MSDGITRRNLATRVIVICLSHYDLSIENVCQFSHLILFDSLHTRHQKLQSTPVKMFHLQLPDIVCFCQQCILMAICIQVSLATLGINCHSLTTLYTRYIPKNDCNQILNLIAYSLQC